MDLFAAPAKRARATGQAPAALCEDLLRTDETLPSDFERENRTFAALGLCGWLCSSVRSMGYKLPTPIQQACIPAILSKRDVLACAETGSGKTAAFVLPMLHILSEDPFGIFAVILTPTRELAIQIHEQIAAFGASLNVTQALAIGGLDLIEQRLQLSRRPHFVIATPGRLFHHLSDAAPPNLSKCRFLVLDEADRLLSLGFAEELEGILPKLNPKRSTLLFSATFSSSLEEVEKLAMNDAVRYDLTKDRKLPLTMTQRYLFVPAKVKLCFLVAVLQRVLNISNAPKQAAQGGKPGKSGKLRPATGKHSHGKSEQPAASQSLTIVFTQSCHRCHEVSLILKEMGIDCVALHSMLSQQQRLQSLHAFKSMSSPVLIATDVASRGLDIPAVDFVMNFDMPRATEDYVHRVGRTARSGRNGEALSFVTQYDIELLQAIEARTGVKMDKFEGVDNDSIVPLLNPLSNAMQEVQQDILSSGVLEKEALVKKRKRQQQRQLLRKQDT